MTCHTVTVSVYPSHSSQNLKSSIWHTCPPGLRDELTTHGTKWLGRDCGPVSVSPATHGTRPPFCYHTHWNIDESLCCCRCLRYSPVTDGSCGIFPAKQPGLFTVNKSCSAGHVFKNRRWRGWGTVLHRVCHYFHLTMIHGQFPAFLESCFVCCLCFYHLEPGETHSAANFIPSPCMTYHRCGFLAIPRWCYLP